MTDLGATTTTQVGDEDDTAGPSTASRGPLDFEPWYRALHPQLVAALFLSTGELDEAADVADEAMARALERWDRVRTMASPDGWAFQVAFNLVRRRGRRRALEHTVLRRSAAGRATSMPAPAGEAWDAVRQLPPRQRQVVALRFLADLPESEIAAVLGISRGTVSSTLVDARRALGPMLADAPHDPAPTPDVETNP